MDAEGYGLLGRGIYAEQSICGPNRIDGLGRNGE